MTHVQEFSKYLDDLTPEKFVRDLKDCVYFDTTSKKYYMSQHVGGYLGKNGFDGRTYVEMFFARLKEIDRTNNCDNYFGATDGK